MTEPSVFPCFAHDHVLAETACINVSEHGCHGHSAVSSRSSF